MRLMLASKTAGAILATGVALAFGLGATPIPFDDPTTIDDVLARREKQAAGWKTIRVEFSRTDNHRAWDAEHYQGHLIVKDANSAVVHFEKSGKVPTDHERILFIPSEIRQYDFTTKQVFVFPRVKGNPTKFPDVIAIPFLLGRKAAEWKERYTISLLKENAKAYVICFEPRECPNPVAPLDSPITLDNNGIRFEPRADEKAVIGRQGNLLERLLAPFTLPPYDFRAAYLQLNKETLLPDRFIIVGWDGKDSQDYTVSGVRCNEPVPENLFRPVIINGWTVRQNPSPSRNESAKP